MNVDIIKMDSRIARVHYRDYLKKVKEHREKRHEAAMKQIHDTGKALRVARKERDRLEQEDEVLMKTYRALSRGQQVLNLNSVLQKAGLNKELLPNLAVARANWKDCFFYGNTQWGSNVKFQNRNQGGNWGLKKQDFITLPNTLFSAEVTNETWRVQNGHSKYPVKALVPAIPAAFRPEGDLGEYFILWEAVWTPAAPVDPLLLKHIEGNMYSVLAQWDLTPLEQSVLEGRIT